MTMNRVKHEWDKYYHRAHWKNLRKLILSRDPVCVICNRNAATDVDHIIPHKGKWELFSAPENLQGLCSTCHSRKTTTEDSGFGNPRRAPVSETNGPQPIGASGKIFQSSSISAKKLDAALDFDIDALLKDLPK